jgi:hypothetical protein
MNTKVAKPTEPGRNDVQVKMPAWLVLALWIWGSLLATALLILARGVA